MEYDVLILGGSYAGLSAAMALGRSVREVLVIDSGRPCNRQTPHSHNFITHDGRTPREIADLAREQVERYDTVRFHNGLATGGRKIEQGFEITTESGESFTGRKLILATGLKDLMPDIPGFAECWGISVVHCPYCHGYEFRDQSTGIMANGERAFHLASLVHNLTPEVTILTSGTADFTEEQIAVLKRHDIDIVETEVAEIEHTDGHLSHVVTADGQRHPFTAVYAAIPFEQHSDIPALLGCELTEHGHIKTDPLQKTSVDGVFACGDNSGMMRSVANAVHTGNLAGAGVNAALVEDDFHA